MLSLSRLVGAPQPRQGEPDLRYDQRIPQTRSGALPGHGPVVVWNWTRTCNLACRHCYAAAVQGRAPGELDSREAHALLVQLAEFRVPALLLSGGEPLARPDALELIAAATGLGLRCTLSTNGTLVDPHTAEALARAGVTYVGISLDGPPTLHDAWRGRRGAHAASLAGIRHLRACGVRVGLRFTLHRDSLAHLPYLLELAQREGIQRVCFYHLVPAGRGADVAELQASRSELSGGLQQLLEAAQAAADTGSEQEILTVGNHSDGPFAYLWLRAHHPERAEAAWSLLRRNGGNRAGMALVAIDPVGDVHPDQFSWNIRLGNVRQTPLAALWQGGSAVPLLDELRAPRQVRIHGRCATCHFFSICNGNLRARAQAATGDFWASDPGCLLTDAELTLAPEDATPPGSRHPAQQPA